MRSVLKDAFGQKAKEEYEQVDMEGKLKAFGLAANLHDEDWPPISAVRELATKIKAAQKFAGDKRAKAQFIMAELKK